MSNSNPLARLFQSYAENIAHHMEKQAEAIECLYGVDTTDAEFDFIVQIIRDCDQQLSANFKIMNELHQQYKLQYKTVDGFILDKLISRTVDNALESPSNPYKPDSNVLKDQFGL